MNDFSNLLEVNKEDQTSGYLLEFNFFGKLYNVNLGCYDGFRVRPRNITERNVALYM